MGCRICAVVAAVAVEVGTLARRREAVLVRACL